MSLFERYKAYRSTDDYKKESYYNKSKLKLIAITFPALIIVCIILKKFFSIEGYTFYFGILFAAILIVNFGADFLTRKKFKE